jgi:hypothetical protein
VPDTFKTLAQVQPGTAVGTIYTVPAATETIIRHIRIVNTDAVTARAVAMYQNGATAPFCILPSTTVAASGMLEVDCFICLQATQTLRASASSAALITITAYGVEIA